MPFQIGHKSVRTKESYRKQGLKMRGRLVSKETRKKLSLKSKGRKFSEEFKERDRETMKKLWQNRKYRQRMVDAHKGQSAWNKGLEMPEFQGEKHPNWRGGLSFLPYLPVFNKRLKLEVRMRDNFICQLCDVKERDYFQKLSINHIDYDKKNNNLSNLITLCRGCNSKVNFQRASWQLYFQDKLKQINYLTT